MGAESVGAGRAARWSAIAAALCLLSIPTGGSTPEQDAGTPAVAGVPRATTGARPRVTAILAPRRQAVLSAEVPGQVTIISKELGERFDSGDVLVQFDDLTYRVNKSMADARVLAAEADLEQVEKLTANQTRLRHAQAVLEAARANLVATERLHDNGHASQVNLANARRDAITAETDCELVATVSAQEQIKARRELALAQGHRDLAGDELDACTIRAPYAGRMARVLVNEHEYVQRGTPLVEVVDDTVLRAKFLLPSELFQSVRMGQELRLTVTETPQTVVVKVTHIAAVLDPASVTFEVYAEVDNADGSLRAGMNGMVNLSEMRGASPTGGTPVPHTLNRRDAGATRATQDERGAQSVRDTRAVS